jgi:hypothetical protein
MREPLAGLNTLPMVVRVTVSAHRASRTPSINEGAGGRGHVDRGATPTKDLCSRG